MLQWRFVCLFVWFNGIPTHKGYPMPRNHCYVFVMYLNVYNKYSRNQVGLGPTKNVFSSYWQQIWQLYFTNVFISTCSNEVFLVFMIKTSYYTIVTKLHHKGKSLIFCFYFNLNLGEFLLYVSNFHWRWQKFCGLLDLRYSFFFFDIFNLEKFFFVLKHVKIAKMNARHYPINTSSWCCSRIYAIMV